MEKSHSKSSSKDYNWYYKNMSTNHHKDIKANEFFCANSFQPTAFARSQTFIRELRDIFINFLDQIFLQRVMRLKS